MRRTTHASDTLAKLDLLADLTVSLPGLTAGELTRVVAFVQRVRRERRGGLRSVSGLVAALPLIELAAQTLDAIDAIDTGAIVCKDASEVQDDAEARSLIGAAADTLGALRDAALTTDGADLDALLVSLRSLADNEPPS